MKGCKAKIFRELKALQDWHQYTDNFLDYNPEDDQRDFNIHVQDRGPNGTARCMEISLHSLVDTEVECGVALTWSIKVYAAADILRAIDRMERAYNLFRQNWKAT